MKLLFSLLLTCLAGTVTAADDFAATETSIKAAMEHERRADDKERDRNRIPVETLKFFKFRDDLTVLELLPGGGWYTRLLGPALKENGKLYISIGAERVFEKIKDDADFSAVELIPFDRKNFIRTPGVRGTSIPEFSFGVKKVDLALTFRNLHNFDEEGRKNMNKAVFEALKHKGLYGVVDHTRRHMQDDSSEVRRRLDPVLVIREIEAVGFEFVDYSDLHYRPDDELIYEVGRRSVTGNTDRFTLLFRKP